MHTSAALRATAWGMGLLQRARPRLRASRHRALGSMWPSSPHSEGPFPRAGLSEFRHASLQPWSAAAPRPPGPHAQPAPGAASPPTHVQAGVVGQQPVVTQGHILLLPLLVQGLAAPLEQNALGTEAASEMEARRGEGLSARRPRGPPPPSSQVTVHVGTETPCGTGAEPGRATRTNPSTGLRAPSSYRGPLSHGGGTPYPRLWAYIRNGRRGSRRPPRISRGGVEHRDLRGPWPPNPCGSPRRGQTST